MGKGSVIEMLRIGKEEKTNILEIPIDLAGSVAELAGVFVGRAVRPADWGGRLTLAAAAPVN